MKILQRLFDGSSVMSVLGTATDVAYQNIFFFSFQKQTGTCYCLLRQLQIPCNIGLELSLTTKLQTSLCCGAGGCAHKDTGITVTWSGARGPLTLPPISLGQTGNKIWNVMNPTFSQVIYSGFVPRLPRPFVPSLSSLHILPNRQFYLVLCVLD